MESFGESRVGKNYKEAYSGKIYGHDYGTWTRFTVSRSHRESQCGAEQLWYNNPTTANTPLLSSWAMLSFVGWVPTTIARTKGWEFSRARGAFCAQTRGVRRAPGKMSANGVATSTRAKNVLGGALEVCCTASRTGFYRDGFCHTGPTDVGVHTVCAILTDEFLEYSRSQGNDLITAVPQHNFPGLKDGDKWCLCVTRWKEAFDVGKAPRVVLEATHAAALRYVSIEDLRSMAVNGDGDSDGDEQG